MLIDGVGFGYFTVNDVVAGSNPATALQARVAQLVEHENFRIRLFPQSMRPMTVLKGVEIGYFKSVCCWFDSNSKTLIRLLVAQR